MIPVIMKPTTEKSKSSDLTSAQFQIWTKAQREMKAGDYRNVLFLTRCLLRSASEFLPARKLAREAARECSHSRSSRWFEKIQRGLALKKAQRFLKQQKFTSSLVVLEQIFEDAPNDMKANRMLVEVALQKQPPSYDLALFALETLVETHPLNLSLQLDLAALALLPDKSGEPWNPARAIDAYHQVLLQDPHHLAARHGLNNALALHSLKNGSWKTASRAY